MALSTENLRMVFAEDGKLDNFKRLTHSLVHGEDIFEYDDNGVEKRVAPSVANKAIRKVFMDVCGLSEDDLKSRKRRKRAEQAHAIELYELAEQEIDFKVNAGFQASEWFNQFVETHNLALGDAIEFEINSDMSLFEVLDYSGSNHDITMQQLPENQKVIVKTSPKVIKIGKDIDLIVLGRVDFDKWIQKIADSYVQHVQSVSFNAFVSAETKLPAQYKGTGTLAAGTKAAFDQLIEDVSIVNGSDVMIMGTKTALKKITNLADVTWASELQKQQMNELGRLGSYEGTTLVEIPQRITLPSGAKMMPVNKLFILPITEDKPVKFVDEGESEIYEVTEKGDLQDDFETYELSRRMGVEVILGQYFGVWTNP